MKKKLLGPMAIGIALTISSCAHMKNDSLSIEEKFHRYDLNDDGMVSPDEYDEVLTRISFLAFDINEDGAVKMDEWEKLEGKDSDPAIFKAHDFNKDGKVTLKEALDCTEKHRSFSKDFPGIDTNRNGFVEIPEAKAYAAKERAVMR